MGGKEIQPGDQSALERYQGGPLELGTSAGAGLGVRNLRALEAAARAGDRSALIAIFSESVDFVVGGLKEGSFSNSKVALIVRDLMTYDWRNGAEDNQGVRQTLEELRDEDLKLVLEALPMVRLEALERMDIEFCSMERLAQYLRKDLGIYSSATTSISRHSGLNENSRSDGINKKSSALASLEEVFAVIEEREGEINLKELLEKVLIKKEGDISDFKTSALEDLSRRFSMAARLFYIFKTEF